jgi:hypothetical protein
MEPPAWPFEILAVLIVEYSVLVPESLRLTCCCLCLCLYKAAREPDASCSTKEEKSENETVRGAGIAVVVPVWPSRLSPGDAVLYIALCCCTCFLARRRGCRTAFFKWKNSHVLDGCYHPRVWHPISLTVWSTVQCSAVQ